MSYQRRKGRTFPLLVRSAIRALTFRFADEFLQFSEYTFSTATPVVSRPLNLLFTANIRPDRNGVEDRATLEAYLS